MGTLTLSTRITLLRIALIPVLLWLLVAEGRIEHAAVPGRDVFLRRSFTDFVDGYLARRWQQTTMLGNFLDTTADKLLVVGALLGPDGAGRVNVWVAFVVIAREIAVLGPAGHRRPPPTWSSRPASGASSSSTSRWSGSPWPSCGRRSGWVRSGWTNGPCWQWPW
jgi:hypothetical protein